MDLNLYSCKCWVGLSIAFTALDLNFYSWIQVTAFYKVQYYNMSKHLPCTVFSLCSCSSSKPFFFFEKFTCPIVNYTLTHLFYKCVSFCSVLSLLLTSSCLFLLFLCFLYRLQHLSILYHMRTLLIFHLLALLKFLIKMLNRILNQTEAKNDLCDRP